MKYNINNTDLNLTILYNLTFLLINTKVDLMLSCFSYYQAQFKRWRRI